MSITNDTDIQPVTTSNSWEHAIARESTAEARSYGRGALAIAAGKREATAETHGSSSHAFASGHKARANSYESASHALATSSYPDSGSTSAVTHGENSCAIAVGGHKNHDYATWTKTEGDCAYSVAVGRYSEATSSGGKAHAIALGETRSAVDITASCSGMRALAIAPEGVARSEHWIGIGAQVILADEESVGVLLPVRGASKMPVIVTGRTHPVGVRLTLDPEGQVVVAD